MSIKLELPEGWKLEKLGDVCDTTSGGTPSRKQPAYYNGHIAWIKSGELDKGVILDSEEKITIDAIKNSSAKVFPKGTLLIALYGATIGKLAFLGIEAATNQAICGIFKNDTINQKYLYNYLLAKRSHLIKQGIGGAQPNISQTILKNLEIPLPALEEQHQIVEKIEELFSELDKGIENLKTAQQQLKVYRQAVLNSITEQEPTHPIESVLDYIDQGWSPKCYNEPSKDNDQWAVIKTTAVQSGYFKDNENKILPESLSPKIQHELKTGDILITRAGPRVRVGICCMVRSVRPRLLNCDKVYRLRVNHAIILPEYVEVLLNSPIYSKQIERMKTGISDSGVNLTQKGFLKILIPVPLILEQQRIVQEIESRLSVCDNLEVTITNSLQQAEALRQSILKRAFEGNLIKEKFHA